MPVYKSSLYQSWPILAKFSSYKPFLVALFCGKAKPYPLNDYLQDFIVEIEALIGADLEFEGSK